MEDIRCYLGVQGSKKSWEEEEFWWSRQGKVRSAPKASSEHSCFVLEQAVLGALIVRHGLIDQPQRVIWSGRKVGMEAELYLLRIR